MVKRRFYEIDILRGAACLAVVAFHYLYRGQQASWVDGHAPAAVEAVAQYGHYGVHLFFIISGFVIFMSAQGATLRSFTASRVSRLYPAWWGCVSITALVVWWCHNPHFTVTAPQWAVNMTMIPQWFAVEFVDGAYWTLAVELQFYLLVAAVVALQWTQRAEMLVAVWLAISAVNAWRPMYPVEFWLAAKWAPLFCAGIIFYRTTTNGFNTARWALLATSYLLSLSYAVGFRLDSELSEHNLQALVVGSGVITAFYLLFFVIVSGRLRTKPSGYTVWIGLMTYPIYLLHQNIGYVLLDIMGRDGFRFPIALLVTVGTVFSLAWAVVVCVERPLAPRLRAWIDGGPVRGLLRR